MKKESLPLLLKLSNEERLDYLNEQIKFMEIEKDFLKKDEEARVAVSKVREASQNFMNITNLMSANRTRVTTSVLDENKVASLHQMSKQISEAIDFSENFSFLFNRYKETQEAFQKYEAELYEKHEVPRNAPAPGMIGIDYANLNAHAIDATQQMWPAQHNFVAPARTLMHTATQEARVFTQPATLAGGHDVDEETPF